MRDHTDYRPRLSSCERDCHPVLSDCDCLHEGKCMMSIFYSRALVSDTERTFGGLQRAMAETSRRRLLQIAFNKENNITPTPLVKRITKNSILDLVSPQNQSSKLADNVELAVAIALGEDQTHDLGDKGLVHDKSKRMQNSVENTKGYIESNPAPTMANLSNASSLYHLKLHDPLLGSVRRDLGKNEVPGATTKERPLAGGRRGATRQRTRGRARSLRAEKQARGNDRHDDMAKQSDRETAADGKAPAAIIASMADQLLKEFEGL